MLLDELRGAYYIALKDIKVYYFKPPNISWGILFPVVLILAFYLRNPYDIRDIVPGLLAMTALFGSTSMEAIVITFEKRVGALERLLLAPISLWGMLLGKVMGGAFFGLVTSFAILVLAIVGFQLNLTHPLLLVISLLISNFLFSSLGAFVSVSVKEVFEAQTLANFFRFPMVFLCGVFLPISSMPLLLQYIARFLPLTYSVYALRASVDSGSTLAILTNILIMLFYGGGLFVLAVGILKRRLP